MEPQNTEKKLPENFSEQYPLDILLAEDDFTNQFLGKKILNKLGYEPDIAENGREVLEFVNRKNYQIILMDIRMPEIDGLEVTKIIRQRQIIQPAIIAMTANAMMGDREICLEAGMDDYICKPFTFQKFVSLLEKWAMHINRDGHLI